MAPAHSGQGYSSSGGPLQQLVVSFFLQKSLQRSSREALQAAGLLQAVSSKKSALQK